MSKPIPHDYTVTLKLPSGTSLSWQIKDCYFERRWAKIGRTVLETIQGIDKEAAFSLTERHLPMCPWHGVDLDDDSQVDAMDDTPCLCEKKYQITLLRLEDGTTHREKFFATDRYAAVAKAFKYFAHKPQADCLETWKVFEAIEVEA